MYSRETSAATDPVDPRGGIAPRQGAQFAQRVDAQLLRGYRNACYGLGGFYLLLTGWRWVLGPAHGLSRILAGESALAAVLFLGAGGLIEPLRRWLRGVENLGLLLVGLALANDVFLVTCFRTSDQIVNFILVQVCAGVAFRSPWRFWLVQAGSLALWAGSFWRWMGPDSLEGNLFMALSGGLFGTLIWLFIRALLRSLARLRVKDRALLRERAELVADLKQALERVKTLHGLIPICAHCKRVRDDRGYWEQVETYIRDRSEATFSHGICPECLGHMASEMADLRNPPPEGEG